MRVTTTMLGGPVVTMPSDQVDAEFSHLIWTNFSGPDSRLPETPSVTYREWDVKPYVKGVARGPERIVTGSDGSAYWTGDHYDTFLMFRGPTQ